MVSRVPSFEGWPSQVGHTVWRWNHGCLSPLSESHPCHTLLVPHAARKADRQSCLRPWKGKIPILIPWAIPPQPKHHPQTSVYLSLHLLEPLAVLSPAVTSLHPDCLQTFYRGAPGVDAVTRLWDCLPHPPFCITLSPAVCKNQIMMVLWSQPAQPLHLPLTHALEDAMNLQSSQQTTHKLLQSNICLIYFFSEVNYTECFFFTLFKADT